MVIQFPFLKISLQIERKSRFLSDFLFPLCLFKFIFVSNYRYYKFRLRRRQLNVGMCHNIDYFKFLFGTGTRRPSRRLNNCRFNDDNDNMNYFSVPILKDESSIIHFPFKKISFFKYTSNVVYITF